MNTDTTTPEPGPVLADFAGTYTRVALANIAREYPNLPAHLVASPAELVPPRSHHPAFYGAYDWHSAVHMHWLLVRLLRGFAGGAADVDEVVGALDAHLAPGPLAVEAEYLRTHPSFERPYGWAWLLALTAECAALGQEPDSHPGAAAGRRWQAALAPAARTVAGLLQDWLPKATYPVRHGTHPNSAFALSLVLDSAAGAGVPELTEPVTGALHGWFADDHAAALRWEPSGQDFLSPLLTEADAMRRVLPAGHFADWLTVFLPELTDSGADFLPVPHISDPSDPQLGHLLGLCLSRALALHGIAAALPAADPRVPALTSTARTHLAAALPATASGDFTTDHWLATFAALALEAQPG